MLHNAIKIVFFLLLVKIKLNIHFGQNLWKYTINSILEHFSNKITKKKEKKL